MSEAERCYQRLPLGERPGEYQTYSAQIQIHVYKRKRKSSSTNLCVYLENFVRACV